MEDMSISVTQQMFIGWSTKQTKKRSELMAPTSSIGRLIRYYSSVLEQQQIVLIEQYIVVW